MLLIFHKRLRQCFKKMLFEINILKYILIGVIVDQLDIHCEVSITIKVVIQRNKLFQGQI